MEAVARTSSVVADDPAIHRATTLLVRRWDAGTPSASRRSRRPGLTEPVAVTGTAVPVPVPVPVPDEMLQRQSFVA